jgi:hypothetical protein
MDRLIVEALLRRGSHRLAGSASLGTVTAFLALVLAIRVGTNVFWAVSLSARHPYVDLAQIAGIHFLLIAAYLAWVGSLSSYRLGRSLPSPSFVDLLPGGRRFVAAFRRRTTFLRPLNLVLALIIIGIAGAFLVTAASDQAVILLRAGLALLVGLAGLELLRALLDRFSPTLSEAQVLELIASLFLVTVNVDIGSVDGKTVALVAVKYYALPGIWMYGAIALTIVLLEACVLGIIRLASALRVASQRRISLPPTAWWYLRSFRLRIWLPMYLVILPVLLSSMITPRTRAWAAVLFAAASGAAFVSVIAQWDNALREKWRTSILERGNQRLLLPPLLIHLLFTMVPLAAYLVSR